MSFLRQSFSHKSYFPAVWFAEADDAHLSDDERARYEQGVAPKLRFTPVKSASAEPSPTGAIAGTSAVGVDAGSSSSLVACGQGAVAHIRPLAVHTSTTARASSYGATSGVSRLRASASTTPRLSSSGASVGGAAVLRAELECRPKHGGAKTNVSALRVDAVKNPTDEEIVAWYLRNRRTTLARIT